MAKLRRVKEISWLTASTGYTQMGTLVRQSWLDVKVRSLIFLPMIAALSYSVNPRVNKDMMMMMMMIEYCQVSSNS